MVRFQPPSAVASSRYEDDEEDDQNVMSEESEGKADEYDNRGGRQRAVRSRQPRTTKAAPTPASRHRFAAPQLDDDDEDTDSEQQLDDTRELEDETDGTDTLDDKYNSKHTSLYPLISDRTERQMGERKPIARRIPMDDTDEPDEVGVYQQRYHGSRERSSSTARNDRPVPANRKRFVAQQDDEDEQLIEQPQPTSITPFPTDSTPPAYLVTPSLLFTPATHSSPSADPALLLSQELTTLSTPPASTTGLATRLPGVTDRFPRHRRAFGAGWGMDGRVTLIRGSSVTVTRVKGDEQSSGMLIEELERERQGRVDMMVAMLQVHHEFAESQQKAVKHGSSASASLSSPRFGGFASSSTTIASTSPIAMLCDRYIAALTALLVSYPSLTSSTSTTALIPSRSFSVASQLRHGISVFQLVKVLYAPEYGSASLSSFLSTPPAALPSLSLSSDFPSQLLSPAAASFDEMYARLHHLKEYFKQQLAPLTPVPSLSAATSTNPPLFSLLSSYMITEATELALSTRHLRLATLLPSLSSVTADFTSMCASQVSEWQNTGVWDVMAEEERQCFLLLAGHKQAEDMHWLRGLSMHVCYQTEGDSSVVKGVGEYVWAVENAKAKPALPPYKYEPPVQRKERRRIVEDDEDDQLQSSDRQRRARQGSDFDTR